MPHISARTYFDKRLSAMKNERSSWDSHWQDLAANFSPRRSKFTETDRNKGGNRNFLTNNTPLLTKRVLRAGMMTGMTSPARPWFRIGPPDPSMDGFKPIREWLDIVERMIYRVFHTSNLYKSLPLIYEDLGVIGIGALGQDEDFDTITRFTTFTPGEYYFDMDGDGRVDTFARPYQMTVYQLVKKFGLENVSSSVKNLYDRGEYDAWVDVRHFVERNDNYDLEGLASISEDFQYRSVYYEVGRNGQAPEGFLRVKGYREFPIHGPRWDPKAGDIYSHSPAMDALGDSRALQVQEREKGKAVAKQVAPPVRAPTSLRNSKIHMEAGGVTFDDDPNNVFTELYRVQVPLGELRQDIRDTVDRIREAMYTDLFLMISQQDDVRTATEIAARQEEKLIQLGPVLESLQDELLDPLIDRTFNMLMRLSEPGWNGTGPELLPPPPPELSDQEVKVEYIGILAQAQKLVATKSTERFVGFVGQLAGLNPEVLDKLNFDRVVDRMGEDLGVPPDIINSQDTVKGMRESRAQAAQAAEQQASMQNLIEGAKQLSDIPTTGGNMLNDVVGVGNQSQG